LISSEEISLKIQQILLESQLVPNVLHFLSLKDQSFFEDNLHKYIKLESAWILSNLLFEEEASIELVLNGVDY
jgi:hypothetical protein